MAALSLFQIELVHSDFKGQSVKYSKLTGHFVTVKWQINSAAQRQSFYFPPRWEMCFFWSFRSRCLWRCSMNGWNVELIKLLLTWYKLFNLEGSWWANRCVEGKFKKNFMMKWLYFKRLNKKPIQWRHGFGMMYLEMADKHPLMLRCMQDSNSSIWVKDWESFHFLNIIWILTT